MRSLGVRFFSNGWAAGELSRQIFKNGFGAIHILTCQQLDVAVVGHAVLIEVAADQKVGVAPPRVRDRPPLDYLDYLTFGLFNSSTPKRTLGLGDFQTL